jgi:hypothetical protein
METRRELEQDGSSAILIQITSKMVLLVHPELKQTATEKSNRLWLGACYFEHSTCP